MTAIASPVPVELRSPFQAISPCHPACIGVGEQRLGRIGRLRRMATLVAVVAATVIASSVVRLWPLAAGRRRAAGAVLRRSTRGLLAVMAVDIDRYVRLPADRAMIVANHISWLDIVALLACERTGRMRLLAKSEVRDWPAIGRLATLAGTIFIDRSRPRTLPVTLAEVRDALVAGDVVVVFAEGTTCCGTHQAPYRPAMFQAALDAQARVVPLAIRYAAADGATDTAAAFLGDETLLTSIRRVVAVPRSRVSLRVGPTLYPQPGAGRRCLARAAQQAAAREVRRTGVSASWRAA
jgi:1-acyl-sn-glycerol-3-phosphate acyltransferase